MVKKNQTLTALVVDEQRTFSTGELCQACAVRTEWLVELVEEGILEPEGTDRANWRFTGVSLQRAIQVRRLQRDLGINLAGAALALELLDELKTLRARLSALQRR